MAIQTNIQKQLWDVFMQQYTQKLRNYFPMIYNTDYTAVIVETRDDAHIETVAKNVMYFLNESNSDIKWGLHIFYHDTNKERVETFTKYWKNVKLTKLDNNITNQNEYSTVLTSLNFWNLINSNNILIFQNDSLLIRHGIDDYLNYNYVGAPWIKPKEGKYIGNGGLSFRKKEKMIEIITNYSDELKDGMYNEDIFFSKYLNVEDVPSLEMCKKFSVEDVPHDNPMGLHQPKIYSQLMKNLLKSGIANIV